LRPQNGVVSRKIPFKGDKNMKGKLLLLPSLAVILTTAVPAQTLSISELFGFPCPNGVCPDGLQPSVLIQASDANFYGVTWAKEEFTKSRLRVR
jgi:hypothetical protein